MRKLHRFVTFLNIQPGEEHLIGSLVLLAFLLELAFVFIQSMAFGVFIAEYGPQSLSYSYIVVAVFGSLIAVVYIKLGERISFSRTLTLTLTFAGVFSFLVWSGLKSSSENMIRLRRNAHDFVVKNKNRTA